MLNRPNNFKRARVLFRASPGEIARFDLDAPFAPLSGRRKPLASVHAQLSSSPDQLAALFAVLGGDPAHAWTEVERRRKTMLVRLSSQFVEALAAVSHRHDAAPDDQKGVELTAIAGRWLDAVKWSREATAGGLWTIVLMDTYEADLALRKGLDLYCWFGPRGAEVGRVARLANELRRSTTH